MAERLDRPRGWIVKQVLAAWVADEETRDQLTREALAAADAGDVIDGEIVSAWVDSLGSENPLPPPAV